MFPVIIKFMTFSNDRGFRNQIMVRIDVYFDRYNLKDDYVS